MFNVFDTVYKDVYAIKVITQKYECLLLPHDGAKIASFKQLNNAYEYLYQNTSINYKRIRINDSYIDGECSSFDDMFPTIDPSICLSGLRTGKLYYDHGEVCRSVFNHKIEDDTLKMEFISHNLDYKYQKIISADIDGGIVVSYKITNLGKDDFYALWAAHCMLNADKGDKLLLPYGKGDKIDIMFDLNNEFGNKGDTVLFTDNMISLNDFNKKGNNYKYYFKDKINKGLIGVKKAGHKDFFIKYCKDKLPYLGIWINNGGFNNMQCIGLEPCTAAYDTVYNAQNKGQKCVIKPNQCLSFELKLFTEQ